MNALQMHELEEVQELTEETKQRFKIENQAQLNWALRKLAALEAEKAGNDQLTADEIERITAWREKANSNINNSMEFFRGLISEFALKQREADPKFKKMKTPYGQVSFREQQPKWHYDEEKLVAHLESINATELIRIKKEPVKTEIKKLYTTLEDGRVVDECGCVVDGIKVEFQADKLEIKTEG